MREWYHDINHGQHLLTIGEIAEGCCTSEQNVKNWLIDNRIREARTSQALIPAEEIVYFLIRHDLPISDSILPPRTKKILFIAEDEYELSRRPRVLDQICRIFSEYCNVLVETSTTGRFANMNIVTFAPDVVIIYPEIYDQDTINTLNFLSNFPDKSTVLIASDLVFAELNREQKNIPPGLFIVSETETVEQILPLIRSFFSNQQE